MCLKSSGLCFLAFFCCFLYELWGFWRDFCAQGRWRLCASHAQSQARSFSGKRGAQRDHELIRAAKRFSPVSVKIEHCNSSLLLLLFLTRSDLPIPPDDFEEKKCS